jgi:hypothetical protein
MGWFSVLVMIPILVVIPALVVLGSVLWRLAFMRSIASMDSVCGEFDGGVYVPQERRGVISSAAISRA